MTRKNKKGEEPNPVSEEMDESTQEVSDEKPDSDDKDDTMASVADIKKRLDKFSDMKRECELELMGELFKTAPKCFVQGYQGVYIGFEDENGEKIGVFPCPLSPVSEKHIAISDPWTVLQFILFVAQSKLV